MTLQHIHPAPQPVAQPSDLLARMSLACFGLGTLCGFHFGGVYWWAALLTSIVVALSGLAIVYLETIRCNIESAAAVLGLSMLKIICELPMWGIIGYGLIGLGIKLIASALTEGDLSDFGIGAASTAIALYVCSRFLRFLRAAKGEALLRPVASTSQAENYVSPGIGITRDAEAEQRVHVCVRPYYQVPATDTAQRRTATRAQMRIAKPRSVRRIAEIGKYSDAVFSFDPKTGDKLRARLPLRAADFGRDTKVSFCPWCGRRLAMHYDIWSRWLTCDLVLGTRPSPSAND